MQRYRQKWGQTDKETEQVRDRDAETNGERLTENGRKTNKELRAGDGDQWLQRWTQSDRLTKRNLEFLQGLWFRFTTA